MASLISEITNCSICMKQFVEPTALPCIHTFCLACLETYGRENQATRVGDELPCPLCRAKFKIPPGGFPKLPQNFFVRQMIDVGQLLERDRSRSRRSSELKCNDCCKKDAGKFCVKCGDGKCDACAATHEMSTHHKIVNRPLNEHERFQVYQDACATYCGVHKAEEFKFYCYDCGETLCADCKDAEHKAHRCADLESASKDFGDKLRDSHPPLHRIIDENRAEMEKLRENADSLTKQTSDCEQAIQERGDEIKRLVDAQCAKLRTQLYRNKDEKIKAMDQRKSEVEKQLRTIENFKTYVEELTDKGSACAVAQGAKDVLARAEELVTGQQEFSRGGSLREERVTFEAAEILDVLKDQLETSAIGSLVFNGVDKRGGGRLLLRPVSCGPKAEDKQTTTLVYAVAAAYNLANNSYAVGIGNGCNEVWKSHFSSEWTRCSDLDRGRHGHCVAAVDNTLYILGGWPDDDPTSATTLSSVVAYSPQKDKWSSAGRLTHSIRYAACVPFRNLIYVFGGDDKRKNKTHWVQVYVPALLQCSMLQSPMPRADSMMRAVLWETSAILLSPRNCFVYDFESQAWMERSDFRADQNNFCLVLDDETLYIAGGGGTETRDMKDGKPIWNYAGDIRSVSVTDVVEGRPVVWKHGAQLPQPAMIFAYGRTEETSNAAAKKAY